MKISPVWNRNAPKKKKTRSTSKPKIRWELLGLSDPAVTEPTAIETIRRSVSSLASQGFGDETLLRSAEQEMKGRARTRRSGGKGVTRRPRNG
ncbi:conserved protein of unknown function [Nitrospira japonica]|uniref:Uncharacterized protein n=1 Tax=Nitrospira japonica TaxID=1325564 RepID=A0A1W1I362_9BACT|nr:conserved protein of unknown function [Nitrospira japonica]